MIHIPTALFIDRYAGRTLCAALDYASRITGRRRETVSIDNVKNILIIKFWGLGNLIEATPAFREIRRAFPDSRITFLTLEGNRGVFDHYDRFDNIYYMPDKSIHGVIREFFELPGRLRRDSFDLVFDMDPIGRFCALISYLSGAPIRIGYSTENQHRERLYTRTVRLNENQHIRRIFLDLLTAAGRTPTDDSLDELPRNEAATAEIEKLFKENGISPDDMIVGMNVNASEVSFERRWPVENFAALADKIADKTGAKILLPGSPSEKEYVARAAAAMRCRPIDISGKTTLPLMVEAIRKCSLFVSNDSGPLHVAFSLGVPTLSFFGPESPERYGPAGGPHVALTSGEPCSPCISFENEKQVDCRRTSACMTGISVAQAYAAFETLFNTVKEKGRPNGRP